MSDLDAHIDGLLLRKHREARGWSTADLAQKSCLSTKQIRQLEEGGTEAFYSSRVKQTAAIKVAKLLELTSEQVLTQSDHMVMEKSIGPKVVEALSSVVTPTTSLPQSPESEPVDVPKSHHISWWIVAALFVTALLAAAWLRPSDEPVNPDAAPPLQALPVDVLEPASAAIEQSADLSKNPPSIMPVNPVPSSPPTSSSTASDIGSP